MNELLKLVEERHSSDPSEYDANAYDFSAISNRSLAEIAAQKIGE